MRQSVYDVNINTKIFIRNQHNHEIGKTESCLKYRDVNDQTNEILKNLFLNGYSQSSAHYTLKLDALIKCNEEFQR